MTQTKTGRRTVLTVGVVVAATATATAGVLALNQTRVAKEPIYTCKSGTAEVEFQVSTNRELPLDIEYFSSGNSPGSARVRTRSWLAVEEAVDCPGAASLHVSNRRESGEVTCTIWADGKIIATRTTRGNDECDVRIKLVTA